MANYYLGIDASKGYADFLLLATDKTAVEPGFQLDDTAAGHEQLRHYFTQFWQRYPEATLYAAIESTGGYEDNWYHELQTLAHALPLQIARLNPAWVKCNSDARGTRNRTDRISARDIAEYQIAHADKVTYTTDDAGATLRRQWNVIALLNKQKTQLLNALEALLYSSMPELLVFCRQGMPTWLLHVLVPYANYQQLRAAGVEHLSQIAYVSAEKAQRIITVVQTGIGTNTLSTTESISTLATHILQLEQLIRQHKQFLASTAQQQFACAIALLLTFTGIGLYSAVGLMVHIGDIQRFPSAKQLASYFGLHPIYKQSGDGTWGVHMSKQGCAEPRVILYMVTWSALRYNPVIKALYAKSLAAGMTPRAAMGVCMHKIVRIVYGMLKHKTPFDPNFEQTKKAARGNPSQQQKTSTTRRLQAFDDNAPISRRQQKKRKEQTQSQDKRIVPCGINASAPSGEQRG